MANLLGKLFILIKSLQLILAGHMHIQYISLSFQHVCAYTRWKDKETIQASFDDAAVTVIDKNVANNMLSTHSNTAKHTHISYVVWLWLWLFAFSDSLDGPITLTSPPLLFSLRFWQGNNDVCFVSLWPFGKLLCLSNLCPYPSWIIQYISNSTLW